MNKKKILDYWNLRAEKKILKCTNDINLETNDNKYFFINHQKQKKCIRYRLWRR